MVVNAIARLGGEKRGRRMPVKYVENPKVGWKGGENDIQGKGSRHDSYTSIGTR